MNKEQKNQISFIKQVSTIKDNFKEKDFDRTEKLLRLRSELTTDIVLLRNKVAEKRFEERKAILNRKCERNLIK